MSHRKITKTDIVEQLLDRSKSNKIVVLFDSSDQKRKAADLIDEQVRNDNRLRLDGRFPFKVTQNAIVAFSNKVTFGITAHEAYFTDVFDDIYHYEDKNEQGSERS